MSCNWGERNRRCSSGGGGRRFWSEKEKEKDAGRVQKTEIHIGIVHFVPRVSHTHSSFLFISCWSSNAIPSVSRHGHHAQRRPPFFGAIAGVSRALCESTRTTLYTSYTRNRTNDGYTCMQNVHTWLAESHMHFLILFPV